MIEISDDLILRLRIAINDASRRTVGEFIHQYVHKGEDIESVRSPGWYTAECIYWETGAKPCSWETSGSEPLVENSIHEHVLSHSPVGVGIARFHREVLDRYLEIRENPQRLDDAQLHLAFHMYRELICRMAEIGYGLRN